MMMRKRDDSNEKQRKMNETFKPKQHMDGVKLTAEKYFQSLSFSPHHCWTVELAQTGNAHRFSPAEPPRSATGLKFR